MPDHSRPSFAPPPPTTTPGLTGVPPESTCLRCGYELTALDPGGDCPECGFAIARSMSADRIADADPRWLGRVLPGLLLLAWGPMTVVIGGILAVTIQSSIAAAGLAERIAVPLLQAAAAGGLVAAAVGGLLVTEAEPRDEGRSSRSEPRVVARWGPVITAVLALAWLLSRAGGGLRLPTFVPPLLAAGAVGVGGFALAALHLRFRELAVRIPSPALADRCTTGHAWYRRWTGFLAILLVLQAVHEVIQQIPRLDRFADLLKLGLVFGSCVGLVVAVIGLVKAIGILDLALSLRSRIQHAIALPANPANPGASADPR